MGKRQGSNTETENKEAEKKEVILTTVVNKTNQKQVVTYDGDSINIEARGKIQIEDKFETVAEKLNFWVEKDILKITKN